MTQRSLQTSQHPRIPHRRNGKTPPSRGPRSIDPPFLPGWTPTPERTPEVPSRAHPPLHVHGGCSGPESLLLPRLRPPESPEEIETAQTGLSDPKTGEAPEGYPRGSHTPGSPRGTCSWRRSRRTRCPRRTHQPDAPSSHPSVSGARPSGARRVDPTARRGARDFLGFP